MTIRERLNTSIFWPIAIVGIIILGAALTLLEWGGFGTFYIPVAVAFFTLGFVFADI